MSPLTQGLNYRLTCDIRAHFFAVLVIPAWNKLPPHIVAVDKVKTFVLALNSLSTEFFRV